MLIFRKTWYLPFCVQLMSELLKDELGSESFFENMLHWWNTISYIFNSQERGH